MGKRAKRNVCVYVSANHFQFEVGLVSLANYDVSLQLSTCYSVRTWTMITFKAIPTPFSVRKLLGLGRDVFSPSVSAQ